jgi:hypothetical protein
MKPNKCIRQTYFKPHNEKFGKVLNLAGFWPPNPGGNDMTMTNFDGWLDPNHPKLYKVI